MIRIEFGEPRFQFAQRNIDGARDVPDLKLVRWTYIEHDDQIVARSVQEFLARDRLHAVAIIEVGPPDAVDLGEITFRNARKRRYHSKHGIVGKPVEHELALPARRDQPSASELLQVLRGVGN